MTEGDAGQDAVLIVGDWVVDEYWLLTRHHSEISSHTGFAHYRIASNVGEPVRDLCGAGHVARVMLHLCTHSGYKYRLLGLGSWNCLDTPLIEHLLHAREDETTCDVANATFTLTPKLCQKAPAIKLHNLDPNAPTIRVVRLYQQEGGKLDQLSRIDWEPVQKDGHARLHWARLGLPKGAGVSAIVVHDLVKGAVSRPNQVGTPAVITQLLRHYGDAMWYVRSKQPRPTWLDEIGDKLALLVLGPEVASLRSPWESWLKGNRVSQEALRVLDRLPGANVVLLTEQREIIVRVSKSGACITDRSPATQDPLAQLGWSSAVFGSLCHHLLVEHKTALTEADVRHALADADAARALPLSTGIQGGETRRSLSSRRMSPSATETKQSPWKEQAVEWEQARSDCGIIAKGKLPRIEIWRGSGGLPGFFCCTEEKQRVIDRIGRNLRIFQRTSVPKRSLSVLLSADPGSGKTVLARALAELFAFSFIQCDITQLARRDDLGELFDTIAARQAADNRNILVFVDEVNSSLEGEPVYSSLLSPIEEGTYVHHGRVSRLKPAVWLFASTGAMHARGEQEKVSDFESRITLKEHIDYGSLSPSEDPAKASFDAGCQLEQVYLGASLIVRYFPDVQHVSERVLQVFRNLSPAARPSRVIRQLAAALRDVAYGQVTLANCKSWPELLPPDTRREDVVAEHLSLEGPDKSRLVRLVF